MTQRVESSMQELQDPVASTLLDANEIPEPPELETNYIDHSQSLPSQPQTATYAASSVSSSSSDSDLDSHLEDVFASSSRSPAGDAQVRSESEVNSNQEWEIFWRVSEERTQRILQMIQHARRELDRLAQRMSEMDQRIQLLSAHTHTTLPTANADEEEAEGVFEPGQVPGDWVEIYIDEHDEITTRPFARVNRFEWDPLVPPARQIRRSHLRKGTLQDLTGSQINVRANAKKHDSS